MLKLPNVLNLQHALTNHPNREFDNQLCLELTEGGGSGYSSPSLFCCSKNLPTASLNPEVAASNLAEEWSRGVPWDPSVSLLPFENLQVSPVGLVPLKNLQKNSEYSSINNFINTCTLKHGGFALILSSVKWL